MTVFAYMRVSTDAQSESGLGLQAQRATIEAEASRRGWLDVEYVTDSGWSGKDMARPAISELLPRLRAGDVLVAAKLDRISRSLSDFAALMKQARAQKWSLICLDIGVDTTTPVGRLVAGIMSSLSEWEREIISDRTRSAMQVAKRNGTRLGRTSTLPASLLDRIERGHRAGVSMAEQARTLTREGVPTSSGCATWYPSTVQSALRSRDNDRLATLRDT